MYHLDLPAGSAIRLNASARPGVAIHRWDIRVLAAGDPDSAAPPRLAYGSQIGGLDCDQRISIPAQDTDCRLVVTSRHTLGGSWANDHCSVGEDTPSHLLLGFCDRTQTGRSQDDVALSFVFERQQQSQQE